ncbi:MAG: polyhydroxyalkanoate synthase [Cognaticolwellia sp.]|jgi:polyhydroxyalkanoate synthase
MSGPAPDPLKAAGQAWLPIDGLSQVERVRRGVHIHSTMPRPSVGQTAFVVVHQHDKLQLKFYAPKGAEQRAPVVLVPSMINRAYILDLEPGRSLVQALSEQGHPVYLVDWGIPQAEDAEEDVAYVLLDLLHRSIDRACRHAGQLKALVMGYCMGGTLSAMLTALRPDRIAGLCVLNAPFDFEQAGRFRELVAHLDVHRSISSDGLVPVEVMKPAFKLLDPMGNWSKYLAIEQASHDPERLRRVMIRERWLEENVPLPGAFAQEFIEQAYQKDALMKGSWQIRGESIDLSSIKVPVLVCSSERDFIAPAPAVEAIGSLIPHARIERLKTGHIGVVVGGFGPKVFYPLLNQWFRSVCPSLEPCT